MRKMLATHGRQAPTTRFRTAPGLDAGTELVALVGSGTIACQIAALRAAREDVILCARSTASAQHAAARIAKLRERVGAAVGAKRATVTTSLDALRHATFVIEAIAEDPYAKTSVLRTIGDRVSPTTIIGSTTSSLSIAKLAKASGRPDRFVGFHVFNPVHRMRLVELAFPEPALPATRARALNLAESMDKQALVVPDAPGFVVNRLLFPYLFDAVQLMERYALTAEDLDTAITVGLSHPLGPLALLDMIGLDVAEHIGEALGLSIPPALSEKVNYGLLGRKSGAGFHDYA